MPQKDSALCPRPYVESLDFLFFQKYTPPGGPTQKKYFEVTTGSRGRSMPNLVGIPPVVWASNPNKQTTFIYIDLDFFLSPGDSLGESELEDCFARLAEGGRPKLAVMGLAGVLRVGGENEASVTLVYRKEKKPFYIFFPNSEVLGPLPVLPRRAAAPGDGRSQAAGGQVVRDSPRIFFIHF